MSRLLKIVALLSFVVFIMVYFITREPPLDPSPADSAPVDEPSPSPSASPPPPPAYSGPVCNDGTPVNPVKGICQGHWVVERNHSPNAPVPWSCHFAWEPVTCQSLGKGTSLKTACYGVSELPLGPEKGTPGDCEKAYGNPPKVGRSESKVVDYVLPCCPK